MTKIKTEVDVEEVVSAKASKSEASVVWSGGKRTYTKELHGDAFADLAKEFAGKKNGKVV